MADGCSQAKNKQVSGIGNKIHTQTGKKAEPVPSDRRLRKLAFILLLRSSHSVQRMDLIQEFITKLQMQSLFIL